MLVEYDLKQVEQYDRRTPVLRTPRGRCIAWWQNPLWLGVVPGGLRLWSLRCADCTTVPVLREYSLVFRMTGASAPDAQVGCSGFIGPSSSVAVVH